MAEWNKCVSFVIGRVVNPGLHAALHENCGGRRVDPPGGHKDQRSKRPKKRYSEEKPPKEGSEKASPKRGPVVRAWIFSHVLD